MAKSQRQDIPERAQAERRAAPPVIRRVDQRGPARKSATPEEGATVQRRTTAGAPAQEETPHPRHSASATDTSRPASKARAKAGTPSAPRKTKGRKKAEDYTPQTDPATGDPEPVSDARIWTSLLLFFMAGYLALSCISYLFYWDTDQNIASWGRILSDPGQDVGNWGGRLGAALSESIIGRSFGIFGELLSLLIFFAAIRIYTPKPSARLIRAIVCTLLVMIVGSVAAGQFFGVDPDVFGSGWGGWHGIFAARWLSEIFGSAGAGFLLVLLFLAVLYYAYGPAIQRFVRKIGKKRNARRERKAIQREIERLQQREKLQRLRAEAIARSHEEYDTDENDPAPGGTEGAPAVAAAPGASHPLREGAREETAVPQSDTEPQAIQRDSPAHQHFSHSATVYPYGAQDTDHAASGEDPVFRPIHRGVDPSRYIHYGDGTLGYVAHYDESGNPLILFFDRYAAAETYRHAPAYAPAHALPPEDDEPDFTVTTRPAAFESMNPVTDGAVRSVAAPGLPAGEAFVVEQPREAQLDDHTVNLTELYDPTLELSAYRKPPVELMDNHSVSVSVTDEELLENKARIITTLKNFGILIDTIEATIGPTVTLYEIVPAPGIRISKIKNLEDDIALSLSALGIRIIAPIPGKGTIGIEVPNKEKEVVSMYSVVKSPKFYNSAADLPVALGKTIQNETFVFDLAKMPHLLVAGATGQGKSVGLNAIIASLLYKKHPAELKFILVDPKKVELTLYQRLEKHFLAKLPDSDEAIITDTQKVIYTLNSLCIEMDRRYDLLKAARVRNIKEYNQKFINRQLNPEKGHHYLPYFVVVVDEFADLIMTAGREIETPIARIAQLARAVGIHLIIATQRPTTNIITGVIKANFPARIAFRVSSMIDSRTILDQPGANQLIGRGDMLFASGSEMTRVQCAFIDTPELERIAEYIGSQRGYVSAYELPEFTPEDGGTGSSARGDTLDKLDPLFYEVARYVVTNQQGSASTIQRKFSIGFNKAGRIVDQLEAAGIVGKQEGNKPRQVLVSDLPTLEIILDTLK